MLVSSSCLGLLLKAGTVLVQDNAAWFPALGGELNDVGELNRLGTETTQRTQFGKLILFWRLLLT